MTASNGFFSAAGVFKITRHLEFVVDNIVYFCAFSIVVLISAGNENGLSCSALNVVDDIYFLLLSLLSMLFASVVYAFDWENTVATSLLLQALSLSSGCLLLLFFKYFYISVVYSSYVYSGVLSFYVALDVCYKFVFFYYFFAMAFYRLKKIAECK